MSERESERQRERERESDFGSSLPPTVPVPGRAVGRLPTTFTPVRVGAVEHGPGGFEELRPQAFSAKKVGGKRRGVGTQQSNCTTSLRYNVRDKETAGNGPGSELRMHRAVRGDCVITYPKGVGGPARGI